MIKQTLYLAAALLTINTATVQANPVFYSQAIQIVADDQWHSFDVDELLSNSENLPWINLDGESIGFEFTLNQAAYLSVVDAGFAGDSFTIYDNGVLLGQTSAAVNNYPDSLGLDFDSAISNDNYSRSVYLLNPGVHSVYGFLSQSALDDLQNPLNATVGAVRLTAVPLPAAFWLFSAGLTLTGLVSRRKHSI
jgi:hypothetical protein